MKELYFKAELLDDVVLSQRMATAGDHKSLDYIPGTTILGAMAARFYSDFYKKDPDLAWNFFNSSKMCFCNAYPMLDEKRSVPMPLSFHSEKVPSPGKENEVLNFVLDKGDEKIQYRQQRSGYVDFDGNKIKVYSVEKNSRMRTAIDAKTGSAAKSQLYGYESMNAGQVFVGKLVWDEVVESTEEFAKIIEVFKKGDVLHIGRSRTASFGRVRISEYKCVSDENIKPEGTRFSVLAVSDLCLRNPVTGRAELQLLPEFLGLNKDDWKIDAEGTFTRPNTIYQYNGKRRELETQKTLISKGSVFTFKSEKSLTSEEIAAVSEKIKTGVGTAKGQGYGEIALLKAEKKYEKISYDVSDEQQIKINLAAEKNLTPKEKDWIEWLSNYTESEDVEKIVRDAVRKFIKLCREIKLFNNFQDDEIFWPSRNQWSRIRDIANVNDKKTIISKIFEGENPVIKKNEHTTRNGNTKVKKPDEEWNYKNSDAPSGITLRQWLRRFIGKTNDSNVTLALKELCNRCSELVDKKDFFKEAD